MCEVNLFCTRKVFQKDGSLILSMNWQNNMGAWGCAVTGGFLLNFILFYFEF